MRHTALAETVALAVPLAALTGIYLLGYQNDVVTTATAPESSLTTELATQPPMEQAHAYATEHGLTDCVDPADAFTSGADVVLTIATDQAGAPTTTQIKPVTLDEALQSGGIRSNLIACKAVAA